MCLSTSATSQRACKLSAADWTAIKKIDRRLERDLWLEESYRFLKRFNPPVEFLPLTQNPPKEELEQRRYQWGLGRTILRALESGDGVDAGAGRCGWANLG